jgi:hypothetical protein
VHARSKYREHRASTEKTQSIRPASIARLANSLLLISALLMTSQLPLGPAVRSIAHSRSLDSLPLPRTSPHCRSGTSPHCPVCVVVQLFPPQDNTIKVQYK